VASYGKRNMEMTKEDKEKRNRQNKKIRDRMRQKTGNKENRMREIE
jgi:hypothetical protein